MRQAELMQKSIFEIAFQKVSYRQVYHSKCLLYLGTTRLAVLASFVTLLICIIKLHIEDVLLFPKSITVQTPLK